MVAAAVLIALGVADRLRDQRLALTDAERRAQSDALTGVLNRRSLLERLDSACLRARARGLPIALLFIDLDHFKQINDTHGHPAGDACLKAIIGPLQAELRQPDVIGRYGGEEFVVILSSADAAARATTIINAIFPVFICLASYETLISILSPAFSVIGWANVINNRSFSNVNGTVVTSSPLLTVTRAGFCFTLSAIVFTRSLPQRTWT